MKMLKWRRDRDDVPWDRKPMPPFAFDSAQRQAIEILATVCDRELGAEATPARALRALLRQPVPEAFGEAVAVFDRLPSSVRRRLADQAASEAQLTRQFVRDVHRQLSGLLGAVNRRPRAGSGRQRPPQG